MKPGDRVTVTDLDSPGTITRKATQGCAKGPHYEITLDFPVQDGGCLLKAVWRTRDWLRTESPRPDLRVVSDETPNLPCDVGQD